jgi:predicted MFS family arabinose efflux permease
MGFIDYPVLAYHMGTSTIIDVIHVPLIYAFVMGIDALAAIGFGLLYDKKGVTSLVISTFLSIFIAPLFFLTKSEVGLFGGLVLWGMAMGAQESVLKAVISRLVTKEKRATAYGVFYTVFGSAWFLGSTIIGGLYEANLMALVIFSSLMESLAMILLFLYHKSQKNNPKNDRAL